MAYMHALVFRFQTLVSRREPMVTSSDIPQLCLSHETALLFWRAVHAGLLPSPHATDDERVPKACVTGLRDLSRIDLSHLGVVLTDAGIMSRFARRRLSQGDKDSWCLMPQGVGINPGVLRPLHVLSAGRSARHGCRAVRPHLMDRELPPGALWRASESVLVTSPELSFVQSCLSNHILPNLELALEMCGTFALLPADLPCRYDRPPLMTNASLQCCLGDFKGLWGTAGARSVLEWVTDGLASPREAAVYLMVALPPALGGYGLPRPSVNVAVSAQGMIAGAVSSADYYVVDLLWVDKRVVLEYDGHAEHDVDPTKVAQDKERRSVLAALGYTVIVIARRDLESMQALRKKIGQVAIALGLGLHTFTRDELAAHEALFVWLANASHDHLPFGCGYR